MRIDPDLVVAIEDGVIVDDYGREHRIRAGCTRWHKHDAAELRRDEVARLFGLSGDGFTRSRSSSTPLRAVEREVPELRHDAAPNVTVKLGRVAREAIRDELRRDGRLIEIGHLETGGCLVAEIKLGGRSARILDATWPGGPGRGYDQVRISEAIGEELAASHREWFRSDARMCGCWHTHPVRVPTPSEPDRANALAFLDRSNEERWLPFAVDMIVSPSRSGEWWHPEVHAWVTRRSPAGTPYTEPATVEGRI